MPDIWLWVSYLYFLSVLEVASRFGVTRECKLIFRSIANKNWGYFVMFCNLFSFVRLRHRAFFVSLKYFTV